MVKHVSSYREIARYQDRDFGSVVLGRVKTSSLVDRVLTGEPRGMTGPDSESSLAVLAEKTKHT